MLATDGALELHVPPASDELSVVVLPTVMVDGPEMVPAAGAASTDITFVV